MDTPQPPQRYLPTYPAESLAPFVNFVDGCQSVARAAGPLLWAGRLAQSQEGSGIHEKTYNQQNPSPGGMCKARSIIHETDGVLIYLYTI